MESLSIYIYVYKGRRKDSRYSRLCWQKKPCKTRTCSKKVQQNFCHWGLIPYYKKLWLSLFVVICLYFFGFSHVFIMVQLQRNHLVAMTDFSDEKYFWLIERKKNIFAGFFFIPSTFFSENFPLWTFYRIFCSFSNFWQCDWISSLA